jgi:hypothetical protein
MLIDYLTVCIIARWALRCTSSHISKRRNIRNIRSIVVVIMAAAGAEPQKSGALPCGPQERNTAPTKLYSMYLVVVGKYGFNLLWERFGGCTSILANGVVCNLRVDDLESWGGRGGGGEGLNILYLLSPMKIWFRCFARCYSLSFHCPVSFGSL